jgi:hypothetical protein
MLAHISIRAAICGYRHTNAGSEQSMWLTRGVLRYDGEHDFAVIQVLLTFLARYQFAMWRKDRRDTHQVLRCNASVAKRQLKGRQALFVFSHSFGEKEALGNHVFAQFRNPPEGI